MRGMTAGPTTPIPTTELPKLPTAQEILDQDEKAKLFQDQKSEAQRLLCQKYLPEMLKRIRDDMDGLRRGQSVDPLMWISGGGGIYNLKYCKHLLEETFANQGVDYLVVEIDRDYHSGWESLRVFIKKGSPLLLNKG